MVSGNEYDRSLFSATSSVQLCGQLKNQFWKYQIFTQPQEPLLCMCAIGTHQRELQRVAPFKDWPLVTGSSLVTCRPTPRTSRTSAN